MPHVMFIIWNYILKYFIFHTIETTFHKYRTINTNFKKDKIAENVKVVREHRRLETNNMDAWEII